MTIFKSDYPPVPDFLKFLFGCAGRIVEVMRKNVCSLWLAPHLSRHAKTYIEMILGGINIILLAFLLRIMLYYDTKNGSLYCSRLGPISLKSPGWYSMEVSLCKYIYFVSSILNLDHLCNAPTKGIFRAANGPWSKIESVQAILMKLKTPESTAIKSPRMNAWGTHESFFTHHLTSSPPSPRWMHLIHRIARG